MAEFIEFNFILITFRNVNYRSQFPCSILYCATEGMSMFDAIENIFLPFKLA